MSMISDLLKASQLHQEQGRDLLGGESFTYTRSISVLGQ